MAHRIEHAVERGAAVRISIDGRTVDAYPGETVATALIAAGVDLFHYSNSGRPRGPFCNMGACFECLVEIGGADERVGQGWVRACMTPVEAGMTIATGVAFAGRTPRDAEHES